jgi:type I restriction enzyme S subunit
MDKLPNGWIETNLSQVAQWGSGGTPSRKIPHYFSGDIPWIKTGELGSKYVRNAEEHISEEAIKKSSAKIFPKDSVGIAMYGATIGKVSIWGIDASTNQACAVAQCYPELIDNEFLYYLLFSEKREFTLALQKPRLSSLIYRLYNLQQIALNGGVCAH